MKVASNLGAGLCVLVVDDDVIQLRLSALQLELAGFKVRTCANPTHVIEMARLEQPDVIMSDVLMGELDGFALCRMLRADERLKATPVLLVSAHFHEHDDRVLAREVGAAGLIQRTGDHSSEVEALVQSLFAEPNTKTPANEMPGLYLQRMSRQLTRLLKKSEGSEARCRALSDQANDAIVELGEKNQLLEVNHRFVEMLGSTREQLVGRSLDEFWAPEFRDAKVNEARAHALRRADGSIVYISFSAVALEIEGGTTVLSIGRDVTKCIENARSLERAEQSHRDLIESLPDAVWAARPDGTLLFVSETLSKMTGWPVEIKSAVPHFELLAHIFEEDRAPVVAAFAALVQDGAPFDVEYRIERPDAGHVWVRNRASISRLGGRPYQITGVLSDITARKRLEDEFRQAQKMESVGQLTGGIAHDFNNMLSVMLANCHFLLADLSAVDPRRADALEIQTAAERAARLTQQLLAFSRRQQTAPTHLNLNHVVRGLEKMLRRVIGEDVELTIDDDLNLGAVLADAGHIEQVIMNLAINARDAMPNGGKLVISTSNVAVVQGPLAKELELTPGLYALISVRDTGFGIDEVTKRRIFEPFFTTKESGKGTGLGLSTSYGIVKQRGGALFVKSTLGGGSTFEVYLPCVDDAAAAPSAQQTEAPLSHGNEAILVIEDDAHVRNAVVRMLSVCGYRVLAAESAEQAVRVAAAAEAAISLVLSDVIMPGANGRVAVEAIQAKRPSVKALYMSGYSDLAVLRDAARVGEINFIQKPFSPQALANQVRATLDGRRSVAIASA